ncbi:MAG: DUF1003 domain-containing protein [Anaerolineales bacterium]|nr:DUF1003 domain-containing protein [Anaerolineales bacterium]
MSEQPKPEDLQHIKRRLSQLGKSEQYVLEQAARRLHVSRNINRDLQTQVTLGQRVADKIAAFGGSWPFVIGFFVLLVLWIALNGFVLAQRGSAFDPYPFILLNLFLSSLAAFQAPIILMSQNRQAARDRFTAEHDYQVNLKAELEILELHEKIDQLRSEQWQALIQFQEEQLALLRQLAQQHTAS